MSDDEPFLGEISSLDTAIMCPPEKPSLAMEITFFLLMASIMLGLTYAGDPTTAVQDIVTKNVNISSTEYGLFSSLYSTPNIVFALFGGIIVDNLVGVRWSAFIFSVIVLFGHTLFTAGFYCNSFPLIGLGRFVVGIGGESLSVATSKYAVLWFKNRSLTLVFSLQLSLVRLGSVLNVLFSQKIYQLFRDKYPHMKNTTCLAMMFLVGVGVCIVSVICSIISGLIDKKVRKSDSITEKKICNDIPVKETRANKIKSYLNLGTPFYMLSLAVVVFYMGFPCFTQFLISHLSNKYMLTGVAASHILSIYLAAGIPISPCVGLLVSLIGYDLLLVFFGMTLCATIHLAFTLSFMNPYVMIILVSISTSIVNCVVWPIVAYVVPEKSIGIGYGIMQCIQNFGLTISPIVSGTLLDHYGFFSVQTYIVIITTISALIWSSLFILDIKSCNGILNAPQRYRELLRNPNLDSEFDA